MPTLIEHERAGEVPEGARGSAESGHSVWIGFTVGWTIYFLLVMSLEITRQIDDFTDQLLLTLLSVGPAVIMSSYVVRARHRLLRPDWGAARTLGVHAAVGLTFAVLTAALTLGLIFATGVGAERLADTPPATLVVGFAFSLTFLYGILIGLLMWAESIRRVRDSEQRVAHEAVLRAEAEAKAVRAQFNPHFVFNTLHSLMLLVRAEPSTAERAIEDVATLIRYASIIQRRDIDAVPLSKELEVARRYLALERLRLGERLHDHWSVAIEPESVTVPSFALQTLVENAIKHGLEPRPEGGRIRVDVSGRDGVVTIVVSDDGMGSRPSDVLTARGHGLDLLRRRLHTRYGDRGRLDFRTAPGEGFTASLTLPAERPTTGGALDVIVSREVASAPA